MITIRIATTKDLSTIMSIIEVARTFMHETGNQNQWINGYPSQGDMLVNIESNHCYVCINNAKEIVGTFCWIIGEDPTYSVIEGGAWLDNAEYGVIHRLATNGKVKGIAHACIMWCLSKHANIRVDTHADNKIMQNIFEKHGFKRCGTIYVANGTPRIAYQRNSV